MIRLFVEKDGMKYIIDEDLPDVGFYLYVFQNGKCIHDYLQDSLMTIKEFALDNFGIELDSWVVMDSSENIF